MRFIIADASGDMAKILYNDLTDSNKYIIIDKTRLFANPVVNAIGRASISLELNSKYRMPLKRLFYKRLFGHFDRKKAICFYFGTSWYDPELLAFLKKKYPNANFVMNFHDTVDSKLKRFRYMDIMQLKEEFDLIYTYNEVDHIKYGFQYIPDMYSKMKLNQLALYPDYDVVFVGAAKDRLKTICRIYKKLSDYGLECWFYVVGAKEEEKQYKNEIIYSDQYLPFLEMISRQVHAKCILEVTQAGSKDATLRFWDAVMYNKRVITNCSAVKNYSYYNDRWVMLFDDVDDIDPAFVKNKDEVDFKYKGDISPVVIFETIEKQLEELNENRKN